MQEISFRLLFRNIITMWVHSKKKHGQKHKNVDLQNTFEVQLDTFKLNLELDTEKIGIITTNKLQNIVQNLSNRSIVNESSFSEKSHRYKYFSTLKI